jgi:hypothetical protein
MSIDLLWYGNTLESGHLEVPEEDNINMNCQRNTSATGRDRLRIVSNDGL